MVDTAVPEMPVSLTLSCLRRISIIIFSVFCVSGFAQQPPHSEVQRAPTNLFCDSTLSTPTSIYFDWSPVGQTNFTYTYSIAGGPPITGTIVAPSHLIVSGLTPGQSVTFTLVANGVTGVAPETVTCNSMCITSVTPTFTQIAPICASVIPPTLPPMSLNGISGTWNPPTITATGTYTFTPNSVLFPCAEDQTMSITVSPAPTPVFNSIPASICQGSAAPILPLTSSNGITGSWSPATINTATLGNSVYTFTPNPGQCAASAVVAVPINITPMITPAFDPIGPICNSVTPIPVLPGTSSNGITGNWSPSTISNTITSTYTFTPNPGQCATTQTMSITVLPRPIPNFAPIAPFCVGSVAPVLSNTAPNGITGNWSPASIDNTSSGSYVFTPSDVCGVPQTLNVTVQQLVLPGFDDISICQGDASPFLPTVSPNGIHGTWSPAVFDNLAGGTYTFTPNPNQCAAPQVIAGIVNTQMLSAVDFVVSNYFADDQTVTVMASPAGTYLYQLDNNTVLSSNVIHNVSSGYHTITVYDPYGCSDPITVVDVFVVNYPHFFTPNGDGVNDLWNIYDLAFELDSRIFIFDRYGKLIKEISPTGEGWDGTYNGEPLPSSDYWFSIDYRENSNPRTFKAHFSLKR